MEIYGYTYRLVQPESDGVQEGPESLVHDADRVWSTPERAVAAARRETEDMFGEEEDDGFDPPLIGMMNGMAQDAPTFLRAGRGYVVNADDIFRLELRRVRLDDPGLVEAVVKARRLLQDLANTAAELRLLWEEHPDLDEELSIGDLIPSDLTEWDLRLSKWREG